MKKQYLKRKTNFFEPDIYDHIGNFLSRFGNTFVLSIFIGIAAFLMYFT